MFKGLCQKRISGISFFCFVLILVASSAHAVPEKDTGNLGEIRQSILSVENFRRIYGEGWVPMHGQDIARSNLRLEGLWGSDRLPDSRGLFLRCMNSGQSFGLGNPVGDLPVGSRQEDEFKTHWHTGVTSSGNPYPYRTVGAGEAGKDSSHNHQTGWTGSTGFVDRTDRGWSNSEHTHDLVIHPTGGLETRPRCMIVNTFIKVNRTPRNQATDSILEAIAGLPALVEANPNLIPLIRRVVQEELRRPQQRR